MIKNNWNKLLADKKLRTEFVLTIIILAIILFSLTRFLNFIENRNGVILNDPLLNLFNPIDLTWLTFGLIYIALIMAVLFLIRNPAKFLLALQCYVVLVIFRIAAMYVTPFDPPAAMISLSDPFVEILGTGKMLTKDLFFSGHTATLLILYLTSEKKIIKQIFLICTIAVAVTLLLQHVHYTIDVLAAPFFAYGSYIIVKKIKEHPGSVSL